MMAGTASARIMVVLPLSRGFMVGSIVSHRRARVRRVCATLAWRAAANRFNCVETSMAPPVLIFGRRGHALFRLLPREGNGAPGGAPLNLPPFGGASPAEGRSPPGAPLSALGPRLSPLSDS